MNHKSGLYVGMLLGPTALRTIEECSQASHPFANASLLLSRAKRERQVYPD